MTNISRIRRTTHYRLMATSTPYRRAYWSAERMAKTKSPDRTCSTWAKHMLEVLK